MANAVRRVRLLSGLDGTAVETRVSVGDDCELDRTQSCAGGISFKHDITQGHTSTRNRMLFWQARSVRRHELMLCELSADLDLKKNSRIWVFRAPVMAVAAVEEPAKGVVKVCVALANRWVVTIELPHPEAVHRARGATGDAYSILSDEAREAVDMEPMHPELFEADAVDFYIPGPGGTLPDGPVLVAGSGRTFLHVWPDGDITAFAQGLGFDWLVEPKNRLVQLSEFISALTPTVLRPSSRGNRVVRAAGGLLSERGGRRHDLWVTLSASLELQAFRTDTSDDAVAAAPGGRGDGIRVMRPGGSGVFRIRDYVPVAAGARGGGALGLLEDRHLLRVAPTLGGDSACNVAVYVAAETQSFLLVLRFDWPEAAGAPQVRHVGTIYAVPDTLIDLCVTPDRIWYVAQTDTVAVITFTDLTHQGSHPGLADPVVPPCALEAEPDVPDDRDPAEVYIEHLFGAGRFTPAAVENALALYDKRAFQLYKLARLVSGVDSTVLGCGSSQMVCAGGAALPVDPAIGFADVWVTLTAGLELRLLTTTHLYDGGVGRPELLAAASDPLPFERYTGGPGTVTLPSGVPDERHLIRVASPSDSPTNGRCYAAVYVASASGRGQSLVVLLQCTVGGGNCELQAIGTLHSVPDTVFDMSIVDNTAVFHLTGVGGAVEAYHVGPLHALSSTGAFRGGGGIRPWAAVAARCDPSDLTRPVRFKSYVLDDGSAVNHVPLDDVFHPYDEALKLVGARASGNEALGRGGGGGNGGSGDGVVAMLKAHVAQSVFKRVDSTPPRTFAELDQQRGWKVQQWHDFRENCLLFEAQGSTVRGFCIHPATNTTYVLTQAGVDVLRPHTPIEAVVADRAGQLDLGLPAPEMSIRADVGRIVSALRVARQLLGGTLSKAMFESTRQHFEDMVVAELQSGESSGDVERLVTVLSPVLNFGESAAHILGTLWEPFVDVDGMDDEGPWAGRSKSFYAGPVGIALIAEEVRSAVWQRLLTVRDMLFAFSAALRLRNTAKFDSDSRAAIARLLPELCLAFQRLYTMHWIASTPASPVSASAVKSIERLLKVVNNSVVFEPRLIGDGSRYTLLELFASEPGVLKDLHAVTRGDPREDALRMASVLFKQIQVGAVRSPNVKLCQFLLQRCQLEELQDYLLLIGRNCGVTAFLRGQVHLRNGEMDKAKVNFLRAVRAIGLDEERDLWSFLTTRLTLDVTDWRQRTAIYLTHVMLFFKESIPQRVRSERDEAVKPAKYRRLRAPRIVIDLARIALNTFNCSMRHVEEEAEKTVSMLWANIFQASLDLGLHDEAFVAAVSTPNELHRRNNLQRLVSVLCERGAFADVVRFPYQRAQVDVLNILERKAEQLSVDAILAGSPNMYSVLYAYHVHTSDYGSAARTMFELAYKLEAALGRTLDRTVSVFRDPTRAEALDRLAKLRDAYLAAINALKLMVRHGTATVDSDGTGSSSSSSSIGGGGGGSADARDAFVLMPRRAVTLKRSRAGTDEPEPPVAPAIDLLGPAELEQRYTIVLARLALVEARPEEEALHDLLSPAFSAADAVQMLTIERRFDLALTVARLFKSSLPPDAVRRVFETVAEDCGRLTIDPSADEPNGWISRCDLDLGRAAPPPLTPSSGGEEADPLDEANTFASAKSCTRGAAAWEYARLLLRTFDAGPDNNYEYHIAMADTVMRLQLVEDPNTYVPLPLWLQRSLEKRHPAALIRLYITHGDMTRASAVVSRLLESATRSAEGIIRELEDKAARPPLHHGEARGSGLRVPMMTIWLPYAEIESLRGELRRRERAGSRVAPSEPSPAAVVEENWKRYSDMAGRVAQLERATPA